MFPPFLSICKAVKNVIGACSLPIGDIQFCGRTVIVATIEKMLIGIILVVGLGSQALADEEQKVKPPLDVKTTFRTICSYCHQDMGRKAGKAPQLMDSQRSDEFIFNRIKNGKPGQMAAFGSSFSDDDIRRIVKYIRSLKADEEPQNPT